MNRFTKKQQQSNNCVSQKINCTDVTALHCYWNNLITAQNYITGIFLFLVQVHAFKSYKTKQTVTSHPQTAQFGCGSHGCVQTWAAAVVVKPIPNQSPATYSSAKVSMRTKERKRWKMLINTNFVFCLNFRHNTAQHFIAKNTITIADNALDALQNANMVQ